jgi:outer membrane receptor for ferrienterochelin and colicins
VVRVEVVGKDEIERRGALTVADALATQTGVRVGGGDYGYLGGVSALQIQGFDRDRVLILEDGERVIGDVGGAIDLATLPASDLERIELVSGPQSALYGASAIGGVVNLISGPPAHPGWSGRGRLETRSRGGKVFQGWGGLRNDDGSWLRLDVSATTQDGVLEGGGPALRLPETTRWMGGLRAGVRVSERWSVRGRARWLREETLGRETRVVPGLGSFVVERPEQGDRYVVQLIAERSMRDGGLRVAGASQVYQGQSERRYPGSPARETRVRGYGLQSLEPVLTRGDGPRTWVLGSRLEAEQFSQQLEKLATGPGGLTREASEEVPGVRRASGALYGQVAWKMGPSWTILPGVRHELHSRYGHAFSPRLAVAWRGGGGGMIRAGVGRGYRAPSAKELGFVFDHSAYGYRVEGNSRLTPERSWGLTLDTSRRVGAVTWKLGGFANRIEDMIDLDLGAPVGAGEGVLTYTYRNRGRARTAGGMVAMQARLGEGLRTELAYDFLWTRDDTAGTPIAGRPPHGLTAGLWAQLPGGAAFNGRWRFFSEAHAGAGPRSPGYSTLDARISRPLWSGSEVYVGATNLLDTQRDPARVGDLRPALGRTWFLGFRADFPAEEDA